MGILDNLRDQADHDISKQMDKELSNENIQFISDSLMSPKMKQLYLYLKEFTQHINKIEQTKKVLNYSKLFPELGELNQENYKINTDGSGGVVNYDKISLIHFAYRYHGATVKEYIHHTSNKLEADRITDFLTSHKVPYTSANNLASKNNGALNFYITKNIPVLFKFTSNPKKSIINLSIKNHENFEDRTIIIKPNDIDEEYLDKLARYILRKDSEFLNIEIDDDVKKQIRQRIEAEKQAKLAEQNTEKESENEEQEKQEKKPKKSFFGKLFK